MKIKRILALLIVMTVVLSIFNGTTVFALNYVINEGANSNMTYNLNTGTFSVSWTIPRPPITGNRNGIGWLPGTNTRTIGYNAGGFNHTSGGIGFTCLAFYGWTRNPLIEYYVAESWVNYVTTGTQVGTLVSDGGTYRIIWENMIGANIDGFGPYKRVKSVRSTSRPQSQNNTITFANHTNAWRNAGHPLGTNHFFQVLMIEGFNSSGNAIVTVWQQ